MGRSEASRATAEQLRHVLSRASRPKEMRVMQFRQETALRALYANEFQK